MIRYLVATSDRNLGLCLRMLDTEKVPFVVEVDKTPKGKTIFKIGVRANKQVFLRMEELYKGLTS